jgi:hypothetical protein
MSEDLQAREALHVLQARLLGLQFLLVHLLRGLSEGSPAADQAILAAFDQAANNIEDFCIAKGEAARHSAEGLQVIEELRAVYARTKPEKRHGV